MIHFSWFCCKWGALVALVVAALTGPYLYHRIDEEIRRRVEQRIADQYPDLAVSVRSARLVENEGIEIRGLLIVEPGASGPEAELAYVEEVFLSGKITWQRLLQGELPISHVLIRRPTIRATRREDGRWSASQLLPLPKLSEEPPAGTIEQGLLVLTDPCKAVASTLTLREANLEFEPIADSPLSDDGRAPLRVHGSLNGDHVQRVELEGVLDTAGKWWRASGTVETLDVSPELIRALPGDCAERWRELTSFRANARGKFNLRQDEAPPGEPAPALDFDVQGQVSRGRLDDTRLPYPLTDVWAMFRFQPESFSIDKLSARSGHASFSLDLQRWGYAANSPMKLSGEGHRLLLDGKLMEVMPVTWQGEWHKFLPSGEVDVKVDLAFDGKKWTPALDVKCRDISFTYHRFPYKLERTRGKLTLRNHVLKADLRAYSEGEEIRLVGELKNPGDEANGWIEVRGDNLRLDEKLFLALDPRPREVVRSLHPRGTFNLSMRCEHGAEPSRQVHKHLVLTLNRCSLKYDHFPYPLDNIRGTIEMTDGLWEFKENLEGTNDTGRITCEGRLVPTPEGNRLDLSFQGQNVPLEEELREALSPGAARLWQDMHPQGTVNLDAIINHTPGAPRPTVWIRAEPVYDKAANLSTSIEPTQFPYRLEKLRGVFIYRDGHVKLENMRAEHGRTDVTADGHCEIFADGRWQLQLDRLTVDRLRADRDVLQALNGRMKRAITDLQPSGPINVRGKLNLASDPQRSGNLLADWNLAIDVQQGSLDCGLELGNLNGTFSLSGGFDGQRFHAYGDLNLDSATYKDFQFTRIVGPFWVDEEQVLLGFWADRKRGVKAERQITAQLYGGVTESSGWVAMGQTPSYAVQARLVEADLARCAQEAISGKQSLSGQVWAQMVLHGKGRGVHNLRGNGEIGLRNADLGELPVMVALLKTLKGRLPDTTAFNSADTDFRIEGEHVYLDRIHCDGDAISLRGKGEVGLDRHVRMTFSTIVGRDEIRLPLINDLMGGASQQIMLIHVDGTLDAPETRREVFPAVAQAIQQLQSVPSAVNPPRQRAASGPTAPRR